MGLTVGKMAYAVVIAKRDVEPGIYESQVVERKGAWYTLKNTKTQWKQNGRTIWHNSPEEAIEEALNLLLFRVDSWRRWGSTKGSRCELADGKAELLKSLRRLRRKTIEIEAMLRVLEKWELDHSGLHNGAGI